MIGNQIKAYRSAGFRVFGIHPFNGTQCECGTPDCNAAGKHPLMSNWQNIPVWSEEQLQTQLEVGRYDFGFGAVVGDDGLVADMDPRNGGQPIKELESCCGFIVRTGGNGLHYYFKRPSGSRLQYHHSDYEGFDFKSSGYVIGAGSPHKSGGKYEVIKGSPAEITDAPQWLIDKLTQTAAVSTFTGGDTETPPLDELLKHIQCFDDYHEWVEVGMAIHHATGGGDQGLALWDQWSAQSEKYDQRSVGKKWAGFGRSSRVVTVATLIKLATDGGYRRPVTFNLTAEQQAEIDQLNGEPSDSFSDVLKEIESVDTKRPPGLVGEVAAWIRSQCLYPRESLAVAKALEVVGSAGGLHYRDAFSGVSANLIVLNVAGSGTGKNFIEAAGQRLYKSIGLDKCHYKAIKSQQECGRNFLAHQLSIYSIDEVAHFFSRSRKSDQAYLSGIIPFLMEAYTATNGVLTISGDMKRDLVAEIGKELSRAQKALEENEPDAQRQIDEIQKMAEAIDQGLPNPFLSLTGYTTPVMLGKIMDSETLDNGFINRCLLFRERDTNPRENPNFVKDKKVPLRLQMALSGLVTTGGSFDTKKGTIRRYNEPEEISYTDDAFKLLMRAKEHIWQRGEIEIEASGNESLTRRCSEQIQKIALICGMGGGIITRDHVLYAIKLVLKDLDIKLMAAKEHHDDATADDVIAARVLGLLSRDQPTKQGVIFNRTRKFKREEVAACVDKLVELGRVRFETKTSPKNGQSFHQFFLV